MGYFSPHISKAILKVAYNIDNDVLLSYLITISNHLLISVHYVFVHKG